MRVFPDSVQFRTLWYLYQASRGAKQRIALKFLLGIAILIGIIKIEKCVLVDSFLGAIHEVSGIVRCPEIPFYLIWLRLYSNNYKGEILERGIS